MKPNLFYVIKILILIAKLNQLPCNITRFVMLSFARLNYISTFAIPIRNLIGWWKFAFSHFHHQFFMWIFQFWFLIKLRCSNLNVEFLATWNVQNEDARVGKIFNDSTRVWLKCYPSRCRGELTKLSCLNVLYETLQRARALNVSPSPSHRDSRYNSQCTLKTHWEDEKYVRSFVCIFHVEHVSCCKSEWLHPFPCRLPLLQQPADFSRRQSSRRWKYFYFTRT